MASLAMPTVICPSQSAASACTSVAGAGAPDLAASSSAMVDVATSSRCGMASANQSAHLAGRRRRGVVDNQPYVRFGRRAG